MVPIIKAANIKGMTPPIPAGRLQPPRPMCKLLIICGLSFAGKSTLGNAIAKRFGHDQVDVDVTKVRLYGENARDDQLTQSDWDNLSRD
jgi:nicotinamide riboside kinase